MTDKTVVYAMVQVKTGDLCMDNGENIIGEDWPTIKAKWAPFVQHNRHLWTLIAGDATGWWMEMPV